MTRVRLVTLNFWGIQPDPERRLALAHTQLAALDADLVAMQEVRPLSGPGHTTADELADRLGMHCVYEVSLRWEQGAFHPGYPAGEEGLAMVSRFPIREHRVTALPDARPTEARILLSVCVESPAGPLWCHTTHLHYRLNDGCARERQVVAVDDVIQHIDTPLPQLLCGDFNATPDHDEIRFLKGQTTLAGRRTHYQDAFERVHPDERGWTWSAENPQTRALRSLDIDRRIDYIFVTTRRRDGRGTIRDCRVVLDERDSEGNCASDHFGVMADVRIA